MLIAGTALIFYGFILKLFYLVCNYVPHLSARTKRKFESFLKIKKETETI
jgi:hypothetical protein